MQDLEYQYTAIDLRTDWVAAGAPFNAPVGTNALVTQYAAGRITSGNKAVATVTTLDQVHMTLVVYYGPCYYLLLIKIPFVFDYVVHSFFKGVA